MGFCWIALAWMMSSTGCAALRDYTGDLIKDQGMKLLAKQIEKQEKKMEEKLSELGLENKKIKENAEDLARALTGEHKDPQAAIVALKKGLEDSKNRDGELEWYGILAGFAYLVKQFLWEKRTENKIKKVVNGGGGSTT